jgi:PAS domain S-box-containing protein
LGVPHRPRDLRGRDVRYLSIGLGYLIVYSIVGRLLAGFPIALSIYGAAGLLLPAALVTAVIVKRRHEWAGCQRLFWDTIAIGMILWCIGHIGWAYGEIVLKRPSWLQWHTMFSLCGGAAPLIALVARPHRGVRAAAASRTALDIAGCGLLAAFLYAYFIMVPSVLPGARQSAQVTLLISAQVLRFATLVALCATAWLARRTIWGLTFATLAIGVGVGFFLRIDTSLAIMSGRYQSGTIHDLAWIIPYLCYSWAALEAPRSPAEERAPAGRGALPIVASAVPVILIPVIGYGWLQVASIGPSIDSFRALLTSLLTVGGLGLLTLRLVAQGDELQRSDARARLLAAATEQTGDLILITRADGTFEHANDAFLRVMGYSRAELATVQFADLLERGMERLRDHISTAIRERGIWRGTLLRRRRDGTTFPSACTVVALKDDYDVVTHFVAVERDITDELKLRDQLVHSERLSAVGELVAGVAHEINNPLQTIVGCVELMLDDQKDPGTRRDLDLVRTEAARAGQIVRNLLSFVRRSTPDRVSADLSQLVRATVELRHYHLHQRDITLKVDYDPSPLPVLVNREEIQQIILNLMLNAEQAIASSRGRGTIAIRTAAQGRHHIVEVSDDGPGIKPELRGKIFEPFFSTKDVGEGTGLGLSISHGIASAHGGSLELCGPDSGGACFMLSLPAHLDAAASGQSPASSYQSIS